MQTVKLIGRYQSPPVLNMKVALFGPSQLNKANGKVFTHLGMNIL